MKIIERSKQAAGSFMVGDSYAKAQGLMPPRELRRLRRLHNPIATTSPPGTP